MARTFAAFIGTIMVVGCSTPPPAKPDPVRDSFSEFVADARNRAKESDGPSRRTEFDSGYGYSPATEQAPAIGSVSLGSTAEIERRKILESVPALSIAQYDLKFAYKDGKWEFQEGTVRHKVTERYITSGREPNEIEPERTDAIKSLDDWEPLAYLFYGKKP